MIKDYLKGNLIMLLIGVYSFGIVFNADAKIFDLVTTQSQLETGAKYLIVGGNFALGIQNTNNRSSIAVTILSNSIDTETATLTTDAKPFEITLGGSNGSWTLYDAVNSGYLRPKTGSTNGLVGNTVSQNWAITVAANTGVASMICENTTTYARNILRFNSTNNPPLFACYASGQADVFLYKLRSSTSTCTASNLAFTQSTISKLVSDGKFTQTATSLNTTTGITYASSNQTVATVNETTGEVTPLTAGSTTITATQAAGTHSAVDYCAATATYTVDVATTAPTITVTEVIVPAMTAFAGTSDTENIQVSGANLTANISLAITGANADLFSLSTNTVTQPTTVIVYYNPTAPGTHTATLTLSSAGATNVVRTLNGSSTWAPLQTPVATAASNITNTGFTANWETVAGATEYELDVTQTSGSVSNATDLFISEYIEGTSYNKVIEIYNGTGATVDLSAYSLKKQINGAGAYGDELTLSGSLTHGEVYVIAYVSGSNSASSTILAQTDLQSPSNAVNFNGNDAIALYKNGIQIDEVGVFNQVADWGKDVTLVRKSSIIAPKTPYSDTEWNSNATDYTTNLGLHTMNGSLLSETPIAGSPFTVVGENTKTFTGLETSKTYKYNVIAKNANVTSAVSNSISVTTSTGTGIEELTNKGFAYVSNGNIIVNTSAGNKIEVYNALGQLLISKLAGAEVSVISLNKKGVVIVKTGTEVVKLIL